MSNELVDLIVKRMIARPDVKARQFNGGYVPVRTPKPEETNIPWTRQDFNDHLAGTRTYGHYLINKDDKVKLFAFDIDLEKTGYLPSDPGYTDPFTHEVDLRSAWHIKAAPPGHGLFDALVWERRQFMKVQFMLVSTMLAKATQDLLGLDVAVAYSGNKGMHVYGFLPDMMSALDAREAAMIVLEQCEFLPHKGQAFFKHVDSDHMHGFPNLTVEAYPKQDSIGNKDLGNLLRLPLGRNLKWSDPTFFVDMTKGAETMIPADPIKALTPGNNPFEG